MTDAVDATTAAGDTGVNYASTTAQILQQGIDNLRMHNAKANEDMNTLLQDMREQIQANYNSIKLTSPAVPPQNDLPNSADVQYKRSLLWQSQWAYEVITAAAMDAEFQQTTQTQAQQILQASMTATEIPTPG